MTSTAPEILARRGLEPALVLTVVVSALVHGGLLALVVAMPGRMLSGPVKIESYTVDLIAPEVVGGTNLVAGPGRREPPAAPPAVAPRPEPAPEPVAPAPQGAVAPVAVPAPPPVPVAEQPRAVALPEAALPQPPPPKPAEEAKLPAPRPPPDQAAKPPEQPKKAQEPAIVPAPEPPEAKLAKPAAARPVGAAAAKPAKPLVAVPNPARLAAPAKQPTTDKSIAAVATKPTAAKMAGTQTGATPVRAADPRDKQIADAVQRRAAQARNTAQRDQQIAAAVQHRAGQVVTGGTRGAGEDGGPISVGPGSGAGGTPMDLEFILYQGKMEERIKTAWAWAGADKALRAVVQFNISPSGEITNIRTVQSSGDRQYDASCERAVRAANPLEPVPEKYRETFATVEMTFKPEDMES